MNHLEIIAIELKQLKEITSSILDFLQASKKQPTKKQNSTKTNNAPAPLESKNSTAYARELGMPGEVIIKNHQYYYLNDLGSIPRKIGNTVADAHRWLEKKAEKINHGGKENGNYS